MHANAPLRIGAPAPGSTELVKQAPHGNSSSSLRTTSRGDESSPCLGWKLASFQQVFRCDSVNYKTHSTSPRESSCMGAFVAVAHVGDIAPGELLRVEVGGKLICLANVAGRIFAVDDDCPHIG